MIHSLKFEISRSGLDFLSINQNVHRLGSYGKNVHVRPLTATEGLFATVPVY